MLGSVYERQKKFDQAEQTFRQVLQIDPNNSQTLNYLGYMMADRNTHLDEALGMTEDERSAWLSRLRAGDPSLASQLEFLLGHHARPRRAGRR